MKATWIVNIIVSLTITAVVSLPNFRVKGDAWLGCSRCSKKLTIMINDYNDEQIREKSGKPLFSIFTESEKNLTMLRSTFPDFEFEHGDEECNYGTIGDFSDLNNYGQIVCAAHGGKLVDTDTKELAATFYSPYKGQFVTQDLPTSWDVGRIARFRQYRFATMLSVAVFLVISLSLRAIYNFAAKSFSSCISSTGKED